MRNSSIIEVTAELAQFEVQLEGPPAYPSTAEPGAGRSFPLGAAVLSNGINFSVFSRHASRVELLLFGDAEEPRPTCTIDLQARKHRTYHYWHIFVPGIGAWLREVLKRPHHRSICHPNLARKAVSGAMKRIGA